MPDALTLLRDDHHKVKDLFKRFEETDDKAEKKRLCDEVIMELDVHTRIEEEIFYPAVLKEDGTKEIMEEAEEEHHVADLLIEELRGKPPTMKNFDAKFKVLAENVKHHIDEEEQMMLPKAAELGRETLERLGNQMEQRKMELMKLAMAGKLTSSRNGATATRSRNGASSGRSTSSAKRTSPGRTTAKRGTTGAAAKRTTTAAKRAVTAAKRTTARATGSRSTTGTRSASGMTRTRASGGTRSTASGRSTATTRKTATATRTRGQASASRTTGTRAASTRRTTAATARKSTATRKPATRSARSKR